MLPIRPGRYNWLVSLFDEGEIFDEWHCTPEMIIATKDYQSPYDEWTGVLNMATGFEVNSKALARQESQTERSVAPKA
jgi:hypothetical protein